MYICNSAFFYLNPSPNHSVKSQQYETHLGYTCPNNAGLIKPHGNGEWKACKSAIHSDAALGRVWNQTCNGSIEKWQQMKHSCPCLVIILNSPSVIVTLHSVNMPAGRKMISTVTIQKISSYISCRKCFKKLNLGWQPHECPKTTIGNDVVALFGDWNGWRHIKWNFSQGQCQQA